MIANLNVKFDDTHVAGYGKEVLQPTGTATNLGVRILPEGSGDYAKFGGSESDDLLNKVNDESAAFNYEAEITQIGNTVSTTGNHTAQATYIPTYHQSPYALAQAEPVFQ